MIDPLTAGKAELEERDRVRMLAEAARIILNQLGDWDEWPHEMLVHYLMKAGFTWEGAATVLEYIDWDDNRHDGESDP